jgi:hypothetical protein
MTVNIGADARDPVHGSVAPGSRLRAPDGHVDGTPISVDKDEGASWFKAHTADLKQLLRIHETLRTQRIPAEIRRNPFIL